MQHYYVINTRNLQHPDDIKKDQFGIRNYSRSHPQAYKVIENEKGHIIVERIVEEESGPCIVHVLYSSFKMLNLNA